MAKPLSNPCRSVLFLSMLSLSVSLSAGEPASGERPEATDSSPKMEENQVTASPAGVVSNPKHVESVDPKYFSPVSQEAIDAVKRAMGGISPQGGYEVKKQTQKYKHAEQYSAPVKAISDTYPVSLHQPIRFNLNLVSGFETEILFFDLKGRPWEVAEISSGNKNLVSAEKSAVLTHAAKVSSAIERMSGRTNLKVRFEGLDTSVSFPVVVNVDAYHETLKVILPGSAPVVEGEGYYPEGAYQMRTALDDPFARAILDNPVDPSSCESRRLIARNITGQPLSGVSGAAFTCNDYLYIRTRHLIGAAPEPNGIVHGPDGFRVYRFSPLSSGEYFSFRNVDGQPVFLEVSLPDNRVGARFGEGVKLK